MVHAPDLFGDDPASRAYDARSIEVLEGLEPVRKRPGMYIGGTDERALHHLVAEVLDNAMDEAVAGHATRIEVELHPDFSVTVRDNGRGIPVDPHPRFPKKSALEVILCTLHAGGKFSGGAYETSGGLHGVGVSVVNALSDRVTVEVARNRQLWRQEFSRGHPHRPAAARSAPPRTAAAPPSPSTPTPRSSAPRSTSARRACCAWCAPRPTSSPASRSAGAATPPASPADEDVPEAATFHFPGGLSDYLGERLDGAQCYAERPFAGPRRLRRALRRRHRRVGGMGDQLDAAARPLRLLLLQHHPHARGRHPRGRASGRRSPAASAPTASSPRTARPPRSPART